MWSNFQKARGTKKYVCRLNKALYDLKQFPRVWYNTLASFFRSFGFEIIGADYSVFINYEIKVIIEVYVDDLFIVGQFKKEIAKLKAAFKERFHMKNINSCSYWLRLKITRDRARRIFQLSQTNYLQQVLKKFDMWESKQQATSMNIFIKLKKAFDNYQAFREFKHRYQSVVGFSHVRHVRHSLRYCLRGIRDLPFRL